MTDVSFKHKWGIIKETKKQKTNRPTDRPTGKKKVKEFVPFNTRDPKKEGKKKFDSVNSIVKLFFSPLL